ncbi:MAG: methylated-DNA--[protein]-cysteine S-methyltransferase [Tepidanaerobacteraceae bacterium]
MEDVKIFWGLFFHKKEKMCLAVSSKGLCYILWPNEPFKILEDWVKKHFPKASLVHDETYTTNYAKQIEEYFKGLRQTFDIPLDLRGTPFQKAVWQALLQIPYGTTKAYSEISKMINRPKAVRAVGGAIGANPIPIVVPCHRVIGKNGTLTGFGGGLKMKKELLEIEGITIIE